jgi:hypothetical protein
MGKGKEEEKMAAHKEKRKWPKDFQDFSLR